MTNQTKFIICANREDLEDFRIVLREDDCGPPEVILKKLTVLGIQPLMWTQYISDVARFKGLTRLHVYERTAANTRYRFSTLFSGEFEGAIIMSRQFNGLDMNSVPISSIDAPCKTDHACICDMTDILRNGCQCGGK